MRLPILLLLLLFAGAAQAGFVVQKTKLEDGKYAEMATQLKKAHMLQDVADQLNEALDVPAKVGLRFSQCGEANSFYDPETKVISMCLELMESFYESLKGEEQSQDDLDDAVAGAFLFYLFHEVGHALIDVLEIPITGREEDAADQLSAWLLIDNKEGDKAVLDAATSFFFESQASEGIEETDFADEHSLDKQRYFNIVCWVYGSSPESYPDLVSEKMLPDARAEQCEGEYQVIDRSWTTLLGDHLKPAAPEPAPSNRTSTRKDNTDDQPHTRRVGTSVRTDAVQPH